MADSIYENINSMYNKQGYFTRYSSDLLITAFICTIVFLIISYYYVMNTLKPIKADWANQRCHPAVIPFAGLINKPSNQSNLDFTSSNFVNCTQSTLEDVASYALMPLYYIMNLITELMQTLKDALNSIRALFNEMRKSVSSVSSELYGRSLNIMLPLVQMFQSIQSMFGKIQASATAAIYTLYGGYITLHSTLLFIYDLVITLMWVLVGIIIACFVIGVFFYPALATGSALAVFLTILLIPIVVLVIIMQDIFSVSGLKSAPSVPHYCFAGSTLLKLQDGVTIMIKDAVPGQILADGSRITGVMRSTSAGMKMFKLNGVIVSSKHKVFDKKLGWIKSSSHPRSTFVDDFRETFIYCIGTDTKIVKIGSTMFSDWDEIDERDLTELRDSPRGRSKLPIGFTKNDIHKHFDSGLHPDTLIYLDDGRAVPIKDIEVNDVLLFGEAVKTIVKITCYDVEEFCSFRHYDEEILRGTANLDVSIHSLADDNELIKVKIEPPAFAYHIVTDTGNFKANGLLIGDYNRAIDQFFSSDNLRDSHNGP